MRSKLYHRSARLKCLAMGLFCILLLMFGCSSTKPERTPEIPDWYLRPPVNDTAYYYGVGDASAADTTVAIQKAVAHARQHLLESIKTELRAETEHKELDSARGAATDFSAVTATATRGILNGAEIERMVWSGDQHVYVLIRCARLPGVPLSPD